MGDPLSTIASICAILELGGKVISYSKDVWNAEREQNEVQAELYGLFSLLTRLRYRVEEARVDEPWFQNVRLLGRKEGEIHQLAEIMGKMAEKTEQRSKSDKWKQALKWKFSKEEVKRLLERIERLKSLVQSALIDDQFNVSLDTQGRVVDTQERVVVIDKQTNKIDMNIEKQIDKDEQDRVSHWLGVPDPSENFHAAIKKRHPDTGLWLVEGSDFGKWKKSEPCLMWLHGNVGCGKTVLSATALETVLKFETSHWDVAVSYFFFDFNDANKQLTEKAARSILLQLARKVPQGFQDLKKLYDTCGSGQMQPSNDQVSSLLRKLIINKKSTYIILDALDECIDREDLMIFTCDLIRSEPKGLRMLATSRRERDIEEYLSLVTNFEINIQSAVVDNDIKIYVQGQLSEDMKLKKWDQSVHEDITKVIMEKANGMFRWVYCQLQLLRKCNRKSEVYKTLNSLPKTLDETYARILRSLESEEKLQDVIVALQWLCYSKCSLRILEMAEVLAMKNGDEGEFILDRFPDPEIVKDYCSSLVTYDTVTNIHDYDADVVNEGDEDKDDDDDDDSDSDDAIRYTKGVPEAYPTKHLAQGPIRSNIIRLAHFSVQEYLLSTRCTFYSDFQAQTCHRIIAESCLQYLLYLNKHAPLVEQNMNCNPLASYAAKYWWLHAQNVHEKDGGTIFDLSSKLLNDKTALRLWIQLGDPEGKRFVIDSPLTLEEIAPPLYYAALVGLPKVTESILLQTPDVNVIGGCYVSALVAASNKGHDKIVQLLLDNGANVEINGIDGTALQEASFHGYEKIVQLLLGNGADVNIHTHGDYCALHAALLNGHKGIVQLLLDNGADINTPGGPRGDTLIAAVFGGNMKVIHLLLDTGLDINTHRGRYGTALQTASLEGNRELVRMLLDVGADINAQGGYYGNALQAAIANGNRELVRMLLDASADINAQGGYYNNALQAALSHGNKELVQILLNAGVDINAHGGRYSNALQAASYIGHEELVRTLLKTGVDVNSRGGEFGNALQAASYEGHEELVRILLNAGADVNAQGGNYGNALQAASTRGREELVRILLNAGADVNAQGGDYGNALQAALYKGHKELVRILLNAGADINTQGGDYGKALQAALSKAYSELLRTLLNIRANVNTQGGDYSNALQAALYKGREELVRVLLNARVDINTKGRYYSNALQACIFRRYKELVRLWLEVRADVRADVNSRGGAFGTVLQAAASHQDNTKTLQVLLDAGADVNSQGGEHGTAQKIALENDNMKVAQMLLDAGAEPIEDSKLALLPKSALETKSCSDVDNEG